MSEMYLHSRLNSFCKRLHQQPILTPCLLVVFTAYMCRLMWRKMHWPIDFVGSCTWSIPNLRDLHDFTALICWISSQPQPCAGLWSKLKFICFSLVMCCSLNVDCFRFEILSLSFRFNGHFSRWTWVSQFYWSLGRWRWWWQLEL